MSWHELRLLGQRVTVLCSPDTFRQREGTRSIRDRLPTYRRRYSRRTGHLTRSVWFHVRAVARAVACAVSSDTHMVDSSSHSGLYSRTGGSCTPSNHLPYRWFARKPRRTLVLKSPDPSATKQRTGKHDLRQSLVRPCHPPRVAAPREATFATRVGPLYTRNPSPRCPTDSPFPIGIQSTSLNRSGRFEALIG